MMTGNGPLFTEIDVTLCSLGFLSIKAIISSAGC